MGLIEECHEGRSEFDEKSVFGEILSTVKIHWRFEQMRSIEGCDENGKFTENGVFGKNVDCEKNSPKVKEGNHEIGKFSENGIFEI